MGLLDIDTELTETKITKEHLDMMGFECQTNLHTFKKFYRKDIFIIKINSRNDIKLHCSMHCIAIAYVEPEGINFKVSLVNCTAWNKSYIKDHAKHLNFKTEYFEIAKDYLNKDFLYDYFRNQLPAGIPA
jgi:hypothetical protein